MERNRFHDSYRPLQREPDNTGSEDIEQAESRIDEELERLKEATLQIPRTDCRITILPYKSIKYKPRD